MKIVLINPQIPQNTGNIVRTAAVTGSSVMLVDPGFSTADRHLKRAGLDYWEGVDVEIVKELDAFYQLLQNTPHPFYFFSSKSKKIYSDIAYTKEDWLIFGSESHGFPPYLKEHWEERFATIPMIEGVRCLNLATSAGIVTYEAWRQLKFI